MKKGVSPPWVDLVNGEEAGGDEFCDGTVGQVSFGGHLFELWGKVIVGGNGALLGEKLHGSWGEGWI